MTLAEDNSANAVDQLRIDELPLPAPGFEIFTFPRYRPMLLGTEQPETLRERLAVGAWLGDRPAGLALYSRPFDEGWRRRLLSVMVSPQLRRHGLGARLLSRGEALAIEKGAKRLTAVHSSHLPARVAFEALLRKSGWSAPKAYEYRIAGKAGWALRAAQDWAFVISRLRERGYGSTLWSDIRDADRESIARMVEADLSESERVFDPFPAEKKLQLIPELSLLLRRHGEIVGWILGSRGAVPDSVYYSHGYVLPSVRHAGWLMAAVLEACQLQAVRLGEDSLSVFETSPDNQGMRLFMERQLKPYSLWSDSRYLSEKETGLMSVSNLSSGQVQVAASP